jgi:Lon-like protease
MEASRVRRWLIVAVLFALVGSGVAFVRGDVPCEVLAVQPSCEVVLRPGPAEDSMALIEVAGAETYPSTGELRLTTVAVDDDLDLQEWLRARTSDTVEAVPRATVFPPGADLDEVAEQNAALMADSQLTATIVALESLGYELDERGARVAAIAGDAVTDAFTEGDVIVAVDDDRVADSAAVVAAVQARDPGERLTFEVVAPDGGRREVAVDLGGAPDDPSRAYVGVLLTTDLDLPVDVRIDAGVIGGPSAGLMFALSIVDLLGEEDLTGGTMVAGTGTVARDGSVGPVGGVRQKLIGATVGGDDGPAEVFLVPRGNLDDTRGASVVNDVLVVPVDTLDDALAALGDLRAGREPSEAQLLAARG